MEKPYKPLKNVVVFIDGNNLFHRMWSFYHTHRIDILELCKRLCNVNRNLKQIRYYYSPFVRQLGERMALLQQSYVEEIKKIENIFISEGKYIKKPILLKQDVRARIKHLINIEDMKTYIEKGVDVAIAIDMITLGLQKEYDTAILVSTDSDFVPVVNYLTSSKIKTQVAAFKDNDHSCYDLQNSCPKSFINLHHVVPSVIKQQKPLKQKDRF